jgi:hypothetical protein
VAATGVVDRISVAPPVALVVGLLLLVGVAIVVVVIAMGFSCRTQADSGDPHEKHGGAETLNKRHG